MGNAGGHALDLSYEGIQIEFQPMNPYVIRAFTALYMLELHYNT